MKLPAIILWIILLCLPVQNINAQCCAAGNPSGTNFNSGICRENLLGVSLFYQHSYSDVYYEGKNKSDFKNIDNSFFNFTSLILNYGLTENINVSADLGFFFDKTQNFDFGTDSNGIESKYSRAANGFGDASFGLQYFFGIDEENKFSLIPGIKVTLPVGQFNQKDGPVILPIDMQPSSGNFKYELGLSLAGKINNDLTLLSLNTFEISQKIEAGKTNYKYGNLYNISALAIYKLIDKVSGILQLRAQYRENSLDKGILLSSTGGFVLFLTPQLSFNIIDDLSINILYELPVYKDMNGLQLTNNYAFGFRISKSFNTNTYGYLFQSEKETIDASLTIKEIKVNGICEMCKDRIEKIAREFENIKYADWDTEAKILSIGYTLEPDFDEIKKAIAKAGHDNETYTANDEDYNKLHSCCKYRK